MNGNRIEKRAYEIEQTLRQQSHEELNALVAKQSGLPEQDFFQNPTLVLTRATTYTWLSYANQNSWIHPIQMAWECRFRSPQLFSVIDPDIATTIILAYLKAQIILQE